MQPLKLLASITDRILVLPGWLVLSLVFAFPALEASAFLGFVFPGEIAVILGGVVASQGRVPLWAVIVAACSGAIIGDSIGYLIGRRWGSHLLHGTIGRLPIIRKHLDKHLDTAQAYVRRRKGSAVFFGRFTAALRVLVPGLAGMSDVRYPTFLLYNVAGGVLWGTGFAVLGYVAGASYKRAEKVAGHIGLLLLALIVVGLIVSRLVRRYRLRFPGLRSFGGGLAATRPLAWIRGHFPRQVAWMRARVDGASPRGFLLTFTVAVGSLAVWAFAGLTRDVVGNDEMALIDPHVTSWIVAHRTDWLTGVMRSFTWLGSTIVIIPVGLAVGLFFLSRRSDWRPLALIGVAVGGAVALYNIVKPAVGRPRPPATMWIGHYPGAAFPSGHALQAIAFYAMLAILLGVGRSPGTKTILWIGAAAVVLVVGASRIYLGAHWLTDVLGGYALGAVWVAIVVAVMLMVTSRGKERVEANRDGSEALVDGRPEDRPHEFLERRPVSSRSRKPAGEKTGRPSATPSM